VTSERLCSCQFRSLLSAVEAAEEVVRLDDRLRCRACGYPINPRWRVRPVLAWYDFFVGLYWNRKKRILYVLPLPCVGVAINWGDNP